MLCVGEESLASAPETRATLYVNSLEMKLKKKKYLLTITGAKLYFYCVKLLDFGVIYYRTNRILCNRCLHSDPNSAVYTLPK